MSKAAPQRRRNLAVVVGCGLMALALVLSGSVLESTIFPSGTVVGTSRRAAALGLSRIVLLAAGLYLVARRPRLTTVHLAAAFAVTLIASTIGALFLQVLLVPPRLIAGWKSTVPTAEQNQLGFRGRQIAYSPEDYVVVLLGDSQVEASALPFAALPEQQLEQHLGRPHTRVFSVGTGGYGQDQELLALQEFLMKYRANLVVLWQTPGNDVWNNVFKTHMFNRNPKPTFWLDDHQQLAGPSEALGQPLADAPVVIASLFQRAFLLPWRDVSWERRLPEPYRPLTSYDGAVRTEWQERWDANIGRMRDEELDTEKSHVTMGLTPRSKRTQYGLDLTRALTQRILQLAGDNKSRLVLFQTDTHDFDSDDDQMYVLNHKFYRVSKRQFRANWDYVNSGFDTEVIPVTVKDWRVGPEDGHLNAVATDQVMAELAERLRTRITDQPSAAAHAPGPQPGRERP